MNPTIPILCGLAFMTAFWLYANAKRVSAPAAGFGLMGSMFAGVLLGILFTHKG